MKHFQFTLKVPGSTSNLGPGFDSIGLAINRFLTIHVESADRWDIHFTNNEIVLPDVKENLFYRAAYRVSELYKKQLPPLKIVMDSEIPLARGLGSSAAAIVGGIETANLVLELNLPLKEKGYIASSFEGHPDNATASLLGGLTISTHTDESTETIVCAAPNIDIVAMIPSFELQTKKARAVLPDQLSYKQAVEASSISNVLVAAIFQNNWVLAGKMMEKDLFHHPYRKQLVPDLVKITELGHELGAYGTILSGAGPTIISFVPKNKGEKIGQLISQKFPNYQYEVLQPISHGVITLPANETMKLVP
ncbi:homoserine kinase [Heyndrickxia sporothermodurans]|uniref:homoserine kinase n=1 Tax=Heyndrickxia sporothermodurans TaxID=46224 RepID=UPI002E23FF8E|nr:homoserine kinase [Heyndrickxia sporothermodurans]MED3652985.1 homoserine kinase [Heyndrickxia sporothermodurans]MED3699430.1 homoserine kinase [Heyndrickxia sporothermodurans]MED3781773.1 homoserine kinase [Heyndrickxia sporothermodurans]